MSRELLPYVSKLTIDSGRKMAVSRATKKGSSYNLVFSDHYTCMLTLKDLPRRREGNEDKRVVWNLAKEGGWIKYAELTNANNMAEELNKVINDDTKSTEEIHHKYSKALDKVKFRSFGKVTIKVDTVSKEQGDNKEGDTEFY